MRILFDHGTPAPLMRHLPEHNVTRAKDAGWDQLVNGDLLAAAEAAGYDILLTTDKNMRYQQNLQDRMIAIIVLGNAQWPHIVPYVDRIVAVVDVATSGSYAEVNIPLPPKKPYTS